MAAVDPDEPAGGLNSVRPEARRHVPRRRRPRRHPRRRRRPVPRRHPDPLPPAPEHRRQAAGAARGGRRPGQRPVHRPPDQHAPAAPGRAADAQSRRPRQAHPPAVALPPLRAGDAWSASAGRRCWSRWSWSSPRTSATCSRSAAPAGRRGDAMLPPTVTGDTVTLRHEELDGLPRTCVIAFCPAPARLSARGRRVRGRGLRPTAGPTSSSRWEPSPRQHRPAARFRAASAHARYGMRSSRRRGATVSSSGRVFNEWLGKSRADLALLTTELATGPYPYAGIPWFSTAFGRDAIVTALQMLWLDPTLARGVLRFLAAHQATETLALRRRGPGQDHARDPQGRDGAAAGAAVRPVLRRRRHDAACSWCWRAPTPTAPGTSP